MELSNKRLLVCVAINLEDNFGERVLNALKFIDYIVGRTEENGVGVVKTILVWFDSFYVRVSTKTAIWTVGHRFKSTPTNGPRLTALCLPWWSPIQLLTEADVARNDEGMSNE
jgi:hypothetical protein